MPDAISILNIPLLARNAAALRTPRMQKEAIDEYGDWVSREVSIGNFSIDPSNGEPLHSSGQDLDEHREAWLKSRPHALVPVILEDPIDDLWTTGNITRRGARLRQLREFCGSDAAALVLLKEEAARFGVTNPLSTQIGTTPGEKPKADGVKAVATSNPWSKAYVERNGIDAAYAERGRVQKTLGLKVANQWAAAAGLSPTGVPLKRS